ncbi:MAG TPA: ABC transporter substrate-binding protein, partial [Usitatibacter sp.]|nr:ABC transporter substrate-binding protein [Usitatibacter sp.]
MESNAALRAQFAPSGVLRAGINLGNPVIAQAGADGGEPNGVGPALARELARRLGLPIAFTTYETAGKLAGAVKEGAWDVAFLAIDPERAQDIDFTDAYVDIEGTYMVRADSPLKRIDEVDRQGIRVAVGLKTAYDLYLSRELKHAELVRSASSKAAIVQFLEEKLDVVAGVKQPLVAKAASTPGLRVMEGNFMVIRQAAAVPRGRSAAKEYFARFIEEMKS